MSCNEITNPTQSSCDAAGCAWNSTNRACEEKPVASEPVASEPARIDQIVSDVKFAYYTFHSDKNCSGTPFKEEVVSTVEEDGKCSGASTKVIIGATRDKCISDCRSADNCVYYSFNSLSTIRSISDLLSGK